MPAENQRVRRGTSAVGATRGSHARPLAVPALLAVAAALIVAHILFYDGPFGSWTYIGFGSGASAVAWAGARWSGFHAATTLIAAGVTLSTIGDIIWEYIAIGDDGPATSLADAAWLGRLHRDRGGPAGRRPRPAVACVSTVTASSTWSSCSW